MQVWAACLTLCMPCWPQAGPAHPCQPPYLQAQPFSLSWVELGTLMEVPQVCYRMILSPYLHTLPPSLDCPRSQLQSWHPKLCQGGRCGGVDSRQAPLSSSHKGSFQHASAWEPLREQDKGPSFSNSQQHRLCPASCSWADGLEPIPGMATLSPVASFGCTQP